MDQIKDIRTRLENDENATGFVISASFDRNGKNSVTYVSRSIPGKPLEVISKENISEEQIDAICDAIYSI